MPTFGGGAVGEGVGSRVSRICLHGLRIVVGISGVRSLD